MQHPIIFSLLLIITLFCVIALAFDVYKMISLGSLGIVGALVTLVIFLPALIPSLLGLYATYYDDCGQKQ